MADLQTFLAAGSPSSALTLSPAVASLVAQNDLDPLLIQGSGPQGRITKEDVLDVVAGRKALLARPKVGGAPASAAAAPASPSAAPAPARTSMLARPRQRWSSEVRDSGWLGGWVGSSTPIENSLTAPYVAPHAKPC